MGRVGSMGRTETIFGPNIIRFSSRLFVYNLMMHVTLQLQSRSVAFGGGEGGGALKKQMIIKQKQKNLHVLLVFEDTTDCLVHKGGR